MAIITSLLFTILFWVITIPLSLLYLTLWLVPFIKNKRYIFDRMSSLWAKSIIWLLRVTCGIDYEIRGWDELDKSKHYIVVGKHQSTFETLVMHTFMKNPSPIFILKKQLVLVPFMGWVLASINHISIDRDGGIKTMKKMVKTAKTYSQKGHNIIIFPQGTRVPPGASIVDYPYKTGFIGIIKECKCDVVPMVLNTGLFWKKKQFLKKKGKIIMEFLSPIKYDDIKDLSKEVIVSKIAEIVEAKTDELIGASRGI
ncbi:MAG: 1-acyl-sn-glycerol-3-phosphate acyltransferase [Rickettsiales bacterium]|nr:1-acyl-sn-glycerol-3-phosphate acyltransferase [Rickettsiales bacterium]